MKIQKSKTICGSEKGYPGVGPGTAYAASSLSLPGITRKRKQISKGFLPAGNPGSSVYDLYMIHIAPSGKSSKDFEMFLKNFSIHIHPLNKNATNFPRKRFLQLEKPLNFYNFATCCSRAFRIFIRSLYSPRSKTVFSTCFSCSLIS